MLISSAASSSFSCPFLLSFLSLPDTGAGPLNLRKGSRALTPSGIIVPRYRKPSGIATGRQGCCQGDRREKKSDLSDPRPLLGSSWPWPLILMQTPPQGPPLSKLGAPLVSGFFPSLPSPLDHGACPESSHDARNDAEPGPGSEQPGEHPRGV